MKVNTISLNSVRLNTIAPNHIGGRSDRWWYEHSDKDSIMLEDGYNLLLTDRSPILLAQGLKIVRQKNNL